MKSAPLPCSACVCSIVSDTFFSNPFDLIHHRFSLKVSNKENEQKQKEKKFNRPRRQKNFVTTCRFFNDSTPLTSYVTWTQLYWIQKWSVNNFIFYYYKFIRPLVPKHSDGICDAPRRLLTHTRPLVFLLLFLSKADGRVYIYCVKTTRTMCTSCVIVISVANNNRDEIETLVNVWAVDTKVYIAISRSIELCFFSYTQ